MAQQGWYPDPRDPRILRWWDGASWTEQTKNAAVARIANKRKGVWLPFGIAVGIIAAISVVAAIGSAGKRSASDDQPARTSAKSYEAPSKPRTYKQVINTNAVLWDSEEALKEASSIARTGSEKAYARLVLAHGRIVREGDEVKRLDGIIVLRVVHVETGEIGWIEREFVTVE